MIQQMSRSPQLTLLFLCILSFVLAGCASRPPRDMDNVCKIFKQYPSWYRYAARSEKKWGVPISTQMAIIHQESRFRAHAKPDRRRILWVIPWKRPSSSYGYSQATKGTWRQYQRETGQGGADRDEMDDVTDFIGWYGRQSYQKLNLKRDNVFGLYLAYHEGWGGYARGSWRKKTWLKKVAQKVQYRARRYNAQLQGCEDKLKRRSKFLGLF